jgi:hypothetical protein
VEIKHDVFRWIGNAVLSERLRPSLSDTRASSAPKDRGNPPGAYSTYHEDLSDSLHTCMPVWLSNSLDEDPCKNLLLALYQQYEVVMEKQNHTVYLSNDLISYSYDPS